MKIILIGIRGSGKSALAIGYSKSKNINYLDTDDLVEDKIKLALLSLKKIESLLKKKNLLFILLEICLR